MLRRRREDAFFSVADSGGGTIDGGFGDCLSITIVLLLCDTGDWTVVVLLFPNNLGLLLLIFVVTLSVPGVSFFDNSVTAAFAVETFFHRFRDERLCSADIGGGAPDGGFGVFTF